MSRALTRRSRLEFSGKLRNRATNSIPVLLRQAFGAGLRATLRAQLLKNPPAMQEILVQFLGREDPLEKEMATHSIILAWEIPWAEDPGRLHSMG